MCKMDKTNISLWLGFEAEKFDGKSGFRLWQFKLKEILIQKGLDKALLGKEKKPANMKAKDWTDLDQKAASVVRLHVTDEVMAKVGDAKSAAAVWKKLEELYAGKPLPNRLLLKSKLYGLSMAEGENVLEHLKTFTSILVDLKNLGVEFEEEDKATILLKSLPPSYNYLAMTLLDHKETLDINEVVASIVTNHIRRATLKNDLVTVKHPGVDKEKRNEEPRLSNSKKYDYVPDQELNICVAGSLAPFRNKWIMIMGVGYHICPRREWFQEYKEGCNGGNIVLLNGSVIKTVGRGTVDIRMSNGIVRRLGDVLHVPELCVNVISVPRVIQKGDCQMTMGRGRGAMEVTRGRGSEVVMEAPEFNNLFCVSGSTVVGGTDQVVNEIL